MDIKHRVLRLTEGYAVASLQALALHNAEVLVGMPGLPFLYDSGVVYRRELEELWSDYPTLLKAGHEDCDALAAARAGELMARGWRALAPGDGGYEAARRLRPARIAAEVMLTTRVPKGQRGMYHCIVRYRVGKRVYRDDPSARLGMFGGKVDRSVLARWRRHGRRARAPLEIR